MIHALDLDFWAHNPRKLHRVSLLRLPARVSATTPVVWAPVDHLIRELHGIERSILWRELENVVVVAIVLCASAIIEALSALTLALHAEITGLCVESQSNGLLGRDWQLFFGIYRCLNIKTRWHLWGIGRVIVELSCGGLIRALILTVKLLLWLLSIFMGLVGRGLSELRLILALVHRRCFIKVRREGESAGFTLNSSAFLNIYKLGCRWDRLLLELAMTFVWFFTTLRYLATRRLRLAVKGEWSSGHSLRVNRWESVGFLTCWRYEASPTLGDDGGCLNQLFFARITTTLAWREQIRLMRILVAACSRTSLLDHGRKLLYIGVELKAICACLAV